MKKFFYLFIIIFSALTVSLVAASGRNDDTRKNAEDKLLKEYLLPSFNLQQINSTHLTILYNNLQNQPHALFKTSDGWYRTERLYQTWNGSGWENSTRYLYGYDGALRNNIYTNQDWINGVWENDYRYEYIYGPDGRMTEYYEYFWENGNWVYGYKTEIRYLPDGHTSMYLFYRWENNNWVYSSRYNYIYDTNNKLTEIFVEVYNNGVWENSYKGLYYYNQLGLTSEYISQNWYNNDWLNSGRSLYSYNSNNYMTEYMWQTWVDNAWLNFNKTENVYNAQNYQTFGYSYLWMPPTGWVYSTRDTYTYNQLNQNDEITTEEWSQATSSWENYYQTQYFYNTNGYLEKELYRTWGNGFWVYDEQTLITYSLLTDAENLSELPGEYRLYQNYPNPFNPTTTIEFQIPDHEFVSLKVYDLVGREITTLISEYKQPGKYSLEFKTQTAELASGVYFYKLTAGNFTSVKKFVIVK
ncbi:MAG: T9SS type A sorting domain-containing protein [Bacteroidota bacterium]